MNRKLISLLLCLVAVVAMLVACSDDKKDDNETKAATLTMLVITEEQVEYTDAEYAALSADEKAVVDMRREQYQAVEDEINQITMPKYTTKIDILYYTEEQYYDALEEKLEKSEEVKTLKAAAKKEYTRFQMKQKGLGIADEETWYKNFVEEYPQYAEYIDMPASLKEDVENDKDAYPEATVEQADILFIGDYDKYVEYIGNGWLANLDNALNSGVAKKLTNVVYPAFLEAAKTDKGYYAIPNNTIVGEYTAMLVNKRLCDKYSDISQIQDLNSALSLIKDVAKYEENVDPVLWNSYSGYTNVHFWSTDYTGRGADTEFTFDPEKFCVLGTSLNPDYTSVNSALPNYYVFGNILKDTKFVNQLKAIKTLEFEGYYGEENSENEFAVGIIKGSGKDIEAYGDEYYRVILEYPVATQEDLFSSMFAVSSFTADVNRCMQIIARLNTDSYFRNLLQYGIKGTNYELDSDDCATRTQDNLYVMDVFKTGNMFKAYPDADKGMNQDTWKYAQSQNIQVVSNPTINFVLRNDDKPDTKSIDVVNKASLEAVETIEKAKNMEELEAAIAKLENFNRSTEYSAYITAKAMNPEKSGEKDFSVFSLYYEWCKTMGYVS